MVLTLKEEAKKFLADVPDEYVFRCSDGRILKNMQELKDALANMTDDTFSYHSSIEKKDFSNWVRDVIGDEKLADELATATSKFQATVLVAARVILLTGK